MYFICMSSSSRWHVTTPDAKDKSVTTPSTQMRLLAQGDIETLPEGTTGLRETPNGIWSRVHLLAGEAEIETPQDGQRRHIGPGEWIALMPRQAHRLHVSDGTTLRYEFLYEGSETTHTPSPPALLTTISDADLQRPMHPRTPGRAPPPGLDEAGVKIVVDRFYDLVRQDKLLAPVFDSKIADAQWPHHLGQMYDFWSAMLLGTGRYEGRPMPKHLAIPQLADEHFIRWLILFKQTVETTCHPTTAAIFIDRAERIAQSFRLAIALQRGEDKTGIMPLRATEL